MKLLFSPSLATTTETASRNLSPLARLESSKHYRNEGHWISDIPFRQISIYNNIYGVQELVM